MPRKKRSNPKTMHNAGKLRKEPTPAERKLWSKIRNNQLGVNFRRQHAIGNFIPDFVCIEKKLIIELDGSQHLEQEEYDEERTRYLNSLDYKVVRFWNNDVMKNMDGVILAIISSSRNSLERPENRVRACARTLFSGNLLGIGLPFVKY